MNILSFRKIGYDGFIDRSENRVCLVPFEGRALRRMKEVIG